MGERQKAVLVGTAPPPHAVFSPNPTAELFSGTTKIAVILLVSRLSYMASLRPQTSKPASRRTSR